MSKSVVVNFIAEATGFQGEIDKIEGAMGKVGHGANGLGLALAGGLTAVGGAMVKFGEPIEQAEIKLKNAINNSGGSFEAMKGQIDGTVSRMEKFGHGSADTQEALAKLTVRLGDPTKALADMGAVAEVAAFNHISLSDAADLVGKAAQGNAKVLKQFGVTVAGVAADTKAHDAALKALTTATDAHAKAIEALNFLEEVQHSKKTLTIADHIALQKAQELVASTGDRVAQAQTKAAETADALAKATSGVNDPVTALGAKLKGVAEDQAQTFHGKIDALKTKLEDFVGTIGQHVGPALVTFGPALAGLGPALTLVKSGVAGLGAAMDFLAANPIILIIAAIAGLVVGIIYAYNHFTWFRDGVKDVFGFIADVAKAAGGIFVSVWHGVADAFGAIWSGIGDLVKGYINLYIEAINVLIRGVDDIAGVLSKIPGVPNIHIPTIPHLASGGIVTSPTLALIGEAGPEAVVPLNGQHGGMGGPNVTVVVQGSLLTVPDLIRQIRQGLQSSGRLNTTALNGYA